MGRDRSRRRFIAQLGAVGIAGVSGCLGDSTGRSDLPRGDVTVRMTPEESFDPAMVRVSTGETVVWINRGTSPQTVTAYEDAVPSLRAYFASGGFGREITARILYPLKGMIRAGAGYAHRFEVPGRYRYFSIPSEHEGMIGTVQVEE